MTDIHSAGETNGILALEHELLTRDFLDLLGTGHLSELRPFLAPTVTFRTTAGTRADGVNDVLSMIRHLIEAFGSFRVRTTAAVVSGAVVTAEIIVEIGFLDEPPQQLVGFSTFCVRDYLITEWQQAWR